MKGNRIKVGLVGCGNICDIYFQNMKTHPVLQVAACSDLLLDRAKAKAKQYGIPKACTVKELLADPAIGIIVNLTVPKAHADIALAAVKAGKSVYNEKPLTIRREDGQKLLKLARSKRVLVGGAPDTFLGAGLQTCRKLIDDGVIGDPVAATAFMMGHGPEGWHPNPTFFYQVGGGPMFDVGPYYVTALVTLLGSVKRVSGSARISFKERLITSKPQYGKKIKVQVPTHIAGVMDFASGAVGTIITSFDVWGAELPRIEIYGSKGTLSVPDPNSFGGPVRVKLAGKEWKEMPLTHNYPQNSRSLGVADMAYALLSGRPHRASGSLAYHVLDIMHAIHDASARGVYAKLKSSCTRPAPLPAGLKYKING